MTGLCGRVQARGPPDFRQNGETRGLVCPGSQRSQAPGAQFQWLPPEGGKALPPALLPGGRRGWAPPGRGDLECAAAGQAPGSAGQVPSLRMAEGVQFVNPDASIPRGACLQGGWSLCPVSVAGPGVNVVGLPRLKVTEAEAQGPGTEVTGARRQSPGLGVGGWDSGRRPNLAVTDSRSLILILRPAASKGLFMSRGSLPHLSLPELELKGLFWGNRNWGTWCLTKNQKSGCLFW